MGDFNHSISPDSPGSQGLGKTLEEETARLSDLEVGGGFCLLDMVQHSETLPHDQQAHTPNTKSKNIKSCLGFYKKKSCDFFSLSLCITLIYICSKCIDVHTACPYTCMKFKYSLKKSIFSYYMFFFSVDFVIYHFPLPVFCFSFSWLKLKLILCFPDHL